ncbi:MAG: 30S ribosomal protein S9 [Candidatus Kapabacteria bacterium]|jgi:small subunit ribosomal protein S9|nr:30S ribosomal protein S9 [Ignavibacteria bacterium]MBP6510912.1 30S ribosomal protein S9 [Candidatus Kapabacteria bacterium]HLP28150.1 30S ribosomal protein S9 [Candidatus Didemnitutus sp.]MBK6420435.1 30S ribosomal protein S9 [Ignavibacteria bacterium]MBK6761604.1 30S ribosomal protein S9 [Ignavibacteria bacterium]
MKMYAGTGRRKTSVAQVRLMSGTGNVLVNRQPIEEYFTVENYRHDALLPLELTKTNQQFDVYVTVRGGGKSGQAGAVRLGVARALVTYNEELRAALRPAGVLTRDPRMVERKKYGQKKARKRFQFSKR